MRTVLWVLFACIFLALLALTVAASLDRDVLTALGQLWPDAWFRATLADAYFGFLTVWLWVAWRERGWAPRLVWLVLFLLLGNFAMSGYAMIQLWRLGPGEPVGNLLLRKEARA